MARKPATTVKVAILAPLSGAVPTFGVSTRDGALMAIDEWNAKGGVLGQADRGRGRRQPVHADPAVNAANKVIDQDKVQYIVGEVCSKASIPISEIAEAKDVVQISPTSTNAKVTLNADGTHQALSSSAPASSTRSRARWAPSSPWKLRAKTAFIMFDQGNDYVRGLAEAFEAAFTEGGGKIVGKESYTSHGHGLLRDPGQGCGRQARCGLPARLLQHREPVIGARPRKRASPLRSWAAMAGTRPTWTGSGRRWLLHQPLRREQDTRPIVQDFVKNYGAKYNGAVPDALATLAYDATNLMFAAIEKAGADDPAQGGQAAMEALELRRRLRHDHLRCAAQPDQERGRLQVKDGKIRRGSTRSLRSSRTRRSPRGRLSRPPLH